MTWANRLVLRNRLFEDKGERKVELLVAPRGSISYTLDGSEPRNGTPYTAPISIGNGEVLLRTFAEADGIETKEDFRFQTKGKKGVQIDETKKGTLNLLTGRRLARAETFKALDEAEKKTISFEKLTITVGQGSQAIQVLIGEVKVDAAFIRSVFDPVLAKFAPDAPVTMAFQKAHFSSGHDLKEFADKLGFELKSSEVEQ